MRKYKSKSISVKNDKMIDKPNEDYYLCDDKRNIYILVDGVSRDREQGRYPNPSPALDVSKIFVKKAYEYIVEYYEKSNNYLNLLFEAIKEGNYAIKEYNSERVWEDNFYPGTVGVLIILKEKNMYYSYIGDCYGIIINEEKNIFTECQTEKIAEHKKEFRASEIRNLICNNKQHPYSYGVLNGNPYAMDFVVQGEIDIEANDKILLCSDGLADIVNEISGKQIYTMKAEEILSKAKGHDDKTLIIIEEEADGKEDF